MKDVLALMSECARRKGCCPPDRLARRSRDVAITWLCQFDPDGTIGRRHSGTVVRQFNRGLDESYYPDDYPSDVEYWLDKQVM
jgi:superfamily II helicase